MLYHCRTNGQTTCQATPIADGAQMWNFTWLAGAVCEQYTDEDGVIEFFRNVVSLLSCNNNYVGTVMPSGS